MIARKFRTVFAVAFAAMTALANAQATAPQRVATVGGDVTEIVYALGAQNRLVGTDSTSIYPPPAAALPKIGYMRSVSVEGVLSLQPELVIASAVAGPPNVLSQLRDIGVTVVQVRNGYDIDTVRAKIETIGDALGLSDAAAVLERQVMRAWAETRAEVVRLGAQHDAPAALFIMAQGASPMVAGEDTAGGSVIELAGARNAAAGMTGYKAITAESVIAAAPSVIVISNEGLQMAGGIDGLLRMPGIADTPAGRARNVVAVDAVALLGFTPRLPGVISTLAQAIHAPAAGEKGGVAR